jgi:hypothetical protein
MSHLSGLAQKSVAGSYKVGNNILSNLCGLEGGFVYVNYLAG